MAKAVFWRSDWFLGVVVTLLMVLAGYSDLLQSLERKAYDMGVQASSRNPSERIAVIAIDDQSIANLGRWPWSRDLHARMTDLLAGAPAKVIGNTVFFSEPQLDPGYVYVTKLTDIIQQSAAEGVAISPEVEKISAVLAEAEITLNTDRRLGESYEKAGSVILPLLFELGEARGRSDKPLPDFVTKNRLPQVEATRCYHQRQRGIVFIEILHDQRLSTHTAIHIETAVQMTEGKRLATQYFNWKQRLRCR